MGHYLFFSNYLFTIHDNLPIYYNATEPLQLKQHRQVSYEPIQQSGPPHYAFARGTPVLLLTSQNPLQGLHTYRVTFSDDRPHTCRQCDRMSCILSGTLAGNGRKSSSPMGRIWFHSACLQGAGIPWCRVPGKGDIHISCKQATYATYES